eukprot:TRINITY_DN19144_c0_g1_i1.p1 TRINITY_DN19144_c0_g1~~TRINITY_DN19144_c0_g1_i1.p1  ORF type:complete len:654 (+),score=228.43 TRINITY_DN19144_c0_g1_i1:131-2092(+)
MKVLKSKAQDGAVDVVSVAPSLDVVAVVTGREVTVYRMPLSKVAQATLPHEATSLCWGPQGRVMGVGTRGSLALLSVEDCSVIAAHLPGVHVQGVQWVHGITPPAPVRKVGDVEGTPAPQSAKHPLAFQDRNLLPLFMPPARAPPTEAHDRIRLKFQALDAAFVALGDGRCHFVAAYADGAVHIIAYGVTRVLTIPVPHEGGAMASLSAFHLLKSVVYRREGGGGAVLSALNLRNIDLPGLSSLALHYELMQAALDVARASAAAARDQAHESERELLRIVSSHQDILRLFIKGPTLRDDLDWISAHCDPGAIAKLVKLTQKNLTEAGKVLVDAVTAALDYAKALMRTVERLRGALGLGEASGTFLRVDKVQGAVQNALRTVVASQVCATHLLSWFAGLPQVCDNRTVPKPAAQGDDGVDLFHDPLVVLRALEMHAEDRHTGWCTAVTRELDELAHAVAALQHEVERGAEALHASASQRAAAATVDLSPPLPSGALLAEAETPAVCRRYYANRTRDGVSVTMLTDKGPKQGQRWRAASYTLAVADCQAAAFYVRSDDDVLLWVACGGASLTLYLYPVVAEGDVETDDGAALRAEAVASCGVEHMGLSGSARATLSCSPRGLAALTLEGEDGRSCVAVYDLEDDDDEDDDDDNEE